MRCVGKKSAIRHGVLTIVLSAFNSKMTLYRDENFKT